jgi:hypothetical protein
MLVSIEAVRYLLCSLLYSSILGAKYQYKLCVCVCAQVGEWEGVLVACTHSELGGG